VGYEQLTIEQVIALGSLALAVATILMTTRRDRASEESRAAARVAEQQVMSDKLDGISELSRETRDTVREVNRQLADHSREIARVETQLDEHDRRLSVIEGRCDRTRLGSD
jgi:septal ring factor EnvC (AmiA/AmiB activator)